MPIFKPSGTSKWYVDVVDPRGKRIRRSTGTEDETAAQEYHDRLKADLWRVSHLGERQARTFDEAALRWISDHQHKRTIGADTLKIGRLRSFFTNLKLHEITGDDCRAAVCEVAPGTKNATKNRYLALLRAILNKAEKEWLWIEKAPHVALYHEPKGRIRWITPEEAHRLIQHLPAHLVPIVRLALATGLRKSNIYGLRWNQIDMQRHVAWVHPDEAKARRAIGVPLNQTAIDVLRSRIGKHQEFVFVFRGKPMQGKGRDGFNDACKRAGITNFRFHDLRHTWASWLIQAGVGLAELQELGGWESIEMVKRYAHLAPDHLRKHSTHIDSLLADFSHTPETGKEKRAA